MDAGKCAGAYDCAIMTSVNRVNLESQRDISGTNGSDGNKLPLIVLGTRARTALIRTLEIEGDAGEEAGVKSEAPQRLLSLRAKLSHAHAGWELHYRSNGITMGNKQSLGGHLMHRREKI